MTTLPSDPADTVRTALENGVLTVWLHRPDAAHARNQAMRKALWQLWTAVADSADVRCVVLTGWGERHFCAGMDLREARGDEAPVERRERMLRYRDIDVLAALPQPTIAAINGTALGGGLEMALACDVRIVAAEAQLGLPEVAIGLVPGGGGTQRLPRIVGYARAFELVVAGRRLSGEQAVAWGLATRCVPRADLADEARALAHAVGAQPHSAVRRAKQLLVASSELPIEDGARTELESLFALLAEPRVAPARP
jgi:enoyl-CoA hydratase/carnithine racemase